MGVSEGVWVFRCVQKRRSVESDCSGCAANRTRTSVAGGEAVIAVLLGWFKARDVSSDGLQLP